MQTNFIYRLKLSGKLMLFKRELQRKIDRSNLDNKIVTLRGFGFFRNKIENGVDRNRQEVRMIC